MSRLVIVVRYGSLRVAATTFPIEATVIDLTITFLDLDGLLLILTNGRFTVQIAWAADDFGDDDRSLRLLRLASGRSYTSCSLLLAAPNGTPVQHPIVVLLLKVYQCLLLLMLLSSAHDDSEVLVSRILAERR